MDIREAAYVGDVNALKRFVEELGIDVNEQNSVNKWTALHWAVKGGYFNAIGYLFEKGADINIKNVSGQSPLDMANPDIAKILSVDKVKEKREAVVADINFEGIKPRAHNSAEALLLHQQYVPRSDPLKIKPTQPTVTDFYLRAKCSSDEYWIEFPLFEKTYHQLYHTIISEFNIDLKTCKIRYIIRKPDTLLRKDWDIARLKSGEEIIIHIVSI